MRSCRTREKGATESNVNRSSLDEPDPSDGARDTKQADLGEEAVRDEIVASNTPQNADLKRVGLNGESAVRSNSPVTPTPLRRSSRTPSISRRRVSTVAPSGRGTTVEKQQDLKTSIFSNGGGKPDRSSLSPTSKKPKVDPKPPPRVTLRKRRSKWDDPDEMLTDPNSPLVDARLRELLCSPKAWDILTREEKERILAKFPDNAEILDHNTPDARPDISALRNNNNFRHDVARYQDGLSRGFHDPEWIRQAQAAHRSREIGGYDDFMAADFEERWEVSMPGWSQTGSRVDTDDGHRPEYALKEPVSNAFIDSNTVVESEDAVNRCEGRSGTSRQESTDPPHKTPTKVSAQGQNDDIGSTDDSKVAPAHHTSQSEDKKNDQAPENSAKGNQAQVEAVRAQDPTKSDGQQLEDSSRSVGVLSVPSLPDAMEGVQHQSREKEYETTESKQIDAVESTENTTAESA
ncbi:Asx homology domain-containing protein [Xylaria grammica]|nr:Asx homology domain-containing protein [Xylaria grammica]